MAVGRSLRASSRRSGTQCSSSLQPFQKGTWARESQGGVAGWPLCCRPSLTPSAHHPRHGLCLLCPPHRHHPAVPHAFAETTPFFKTWLKLGFSQVPFSSQLSSSFGWYPTLQQGDCSPCLQISCAGGKVLGSGGAGGGRHSFCSQLMGKIGTRINN